MSSKRSKQERRAHLGSATPAAKRFTRRAWLGAAAGGAVLVVLGKRAWGTSAVADGATTVTVYRDPNCGCCHKWVTHMREAGFNVLERNAPDAAALKRERGVPEALYSCHTALAGDFVFEGHVPSDLVQRVLRERPAILGLSAPGMPQSAPGMDMGHEKYEVISFTKEGKTAVYAERS